MQMMLGTSTQLRNVIIKQIYLIIRVMIYLAMVMRNVNISIIMINLIQICRFIHTKVHNQRKVANKIIRHQEACLIG